ncbi:SirB2 family protein [Marinicella sp. W31]|uniref:SirB2 family protein n=1 Tax=Marinicella sp. W31 TaxID=3023713 RepID=UPI0037566AA9
MYIGLKHTHILIAIISFVLFELRFFLMHIRKKPLGKLLRVLPHIVDTLLLASGITLIILAGFDLMQTEWLLLKIGLVVLYIILGIVAMRSTGTKSVVAFILATLVIVYIFLLALNKNPLFFMS